MTDGRDPESFQEFAVSSTKHAYRSNKAALNHRLNDDDLKAISDSDLDSDLDSDSDSDVEELSPADDDGPEDSSNAIDSPVPKHRRRRILERNRVAASKCRVRKRDEVTELVTRERDLEDKFHHLSSSLEALSDEMYSLKSQLLQHTHCDCELIQRYIAIEARKSIDDSLTDPPSSEHHSTNNSVRHSLSLSMGESINITPEESSFNCEYPVIQFINPFDQQGYSTGAMSNEMMGMLAMDAMETGPEISTISSSWIFAHQLPTSHNMPDVGTNESSEEYATFN